MDLDQIQIAWAAGLFEGEGCVYASPQRKGLSPPQPRAKLLMTDFEPVRRFHEVVGIGFVREDTYNARKNPRHAPGLAWMCDGRENVEILRDLLIPFLCERRKAQFVAALADAAPSGLNWHERREYARKWRERSAVA